MIKEIKTGTVEGTGSAINLELGFIPSYVKLFNYDDADGLAPTIEWFNGMADASGLKSLSITDSGSGGTKSTELITSNGISDYVGVAVTNSQGITIGADTDINVSGETIYYIAVR